jgi:hypothetical protein
VSATSTFHILSIINVFQAKRVYLYIDDLKYPLFPSSFPPATSVNSQPPNYCFRQGVESQCQTNGNKILRASPTKMLMISNGGGEGEEGPDGQPSKPNSSGPETGEHGPCNGNGKEMREEEVNVGAQVPEPHSSASSTSSSLSSSASTPMSPPAGGQVTQLPAAMASLSLNGSGLPPHALPHFLASVPAPAHHHGPPPFLYHPHPHHPGGFVYAPPIYNGKPPRNNPSNS